MAETLREKLQALCPPDCSGSDECAAIRARKDGARIALEMARERILAQFPQSGPLYVEDIGTLLAILTAGKDGGR